MSLNTTNFSPDALRAAWEELKAKAPHTYPREAAAKLGVSEARLVALGNGSTSFRLEVPELLGLFEGLARFGEALYLVRNDHAVLEKDSILKFEDKGDCLLATGEGARLAVGKAGIAHVFAVHAGQWVRRGLQFFDASGTAILKAYIRDESKIAGFDAWVKPWVSADQSPALAAAPSPAGKPADAGAPGFPHDCRRSGGHACPGAHSGAAGNAGSVRLALPADSFKTLLGAAAKSASPITVSVAGAHSFLSVTAPVTKLSVMGPWFNILDKRLHLHLNEGSVKSAAATTDTATGVVTVAFKTESGAPVLWLRVAGDVAAAAMMAPASAPAGDFGR
jgi:putative hemin transport protein